MSYTRTLVLLALALATATSTAAPRTGIVVESHTGPRPADAASVLSPVLDELATRGYASGGSDVGRRFEAQISRAAKASEGTARHATRIDEGHRAWISGKFDEAVTILAPIIDAAQADPLSFAGDPKLRDQLTKAQVALALAQHRRGDTAEARTTLAELIRSAPEATIQKGIYGPDAAALFDQVKRELSTATRGRLLVKLDDEQAEVFINERLERRGTTVKELIPGEYRVVIRQDGRASRIHRAVIEPGKELTLTVDLGFDAVVRASAAWAGFEFGTTAQREQAEAGYAAAFANAIGGGSVVVLGLDQVQGRPAIVGTLVNLVNGREIRRASVALDPAPGARRMRALASFLAGENATDDIDVQIAGDPAVVKSVRVVGGGSNAPREESSRRWGGWTWIAGTGAAAGLATGAILLTLDGTCPDDNPDPNCPNLYNTAAPGWIAIGGGAALAAVTIYLIVSRPKARASSSAFLVPTGGGAMAGYATRF